MKNKIKETVLRTQLKGKESLERAFSKKRKGDSKFIAAALLMLFALGIGLIFYNTVTGQLTTLFNSIGAKLQQLINLFTGA